MSKRYTVAVDFDGVLHSYTSPWKNARTIPDPPVPGALDWLYRTVGKFNVAVYSTRNFHWFGRWAMKAWLRKHLRDYFWETHDELLKGTWTLLDCEDTVSIMVDQVMEEISFPKHKPAALLYIDDRAWRFEGANWPTADQIHRARPWNRRATSEVTP